jgi:hypothetical protein
VRDHRVSNYVFFVEFHDTHFRQIAKAMNGVHKTILAAEYFEVGLFSVANEADLGVFSDATQNGLAVRGQEIL